MNSTAVSIIIISVCLALIIPTLVLLIYYNQNNTVSTEIINDRLSKHDTFLEKHLEKHFEKHFEQNNEILQAVEPDGYPVSKDYKAYRGKTMFDGCINHIIDELFHEYEVVSETSLCPILRIGDCHVMIITAYHNTDDMVRNRINEVLQQTSNVKIIFVDGEPNDACIPYKEIDTIISTKQHVISEYKDTSIYLPYMAMFINEFEILYGSLTRQRQFDINEWKARHQLMFFGHGNDYTLKFTGVQNRGRFYRLARQRFGDSVRNMGRTEMSKLDMPQSNYKVNNNGDMRKKGFELGSNQFLLQHFKFAICFENDAIEGYITEKILNPLIAHCIPIYLGAPDIAHWINKDCFIDVNDYTTYDECLDDITKLQFDDIRLARMLNASCLTQSFMNGNPGSYIKGYGKFYSDVFGKINKELLDHSNICRAIDHDVVAVTFADGKNCQAIRLTKELETSAYFNRHISATTITLLPKTFTQQWGEFMNTNKKGFGYYVWKSIVVLNALHTMNDGDLLVWLDSGMHIKPGCGTRVLQDYYKRLIDSKESVMAFRIKYMEDAWTKRDLKEYIGELPANTTPNQFCTGVIIFQKSTKSMHLVSEWVRISQLQNGHMIDDSTSTSGPEMDCFNQHRHDQSIFSLLAKKYGCLVCDDNITDDHLSNDMVFQPRRWRELKHSQQ